VHLKTTSNNTKHLKLISEAKNVTDYLKDVPDKRKEALTNLRKLCKEVLEDYEESMAYGGQLV